MKEILDLLGIFGAQVAVADGDELKLLRAYTLAPKGYPITQPTTRFPLGSISKAITGSATLLLWMKLKVLETQNGDSALADPADILFNRPLKEISFFWHTHDVPDRNGQLVPARWHNGQITGGTAIAFRRDDGLSVVVTVNQSTPPARDATGLKVSSGSFQMNKLGSEINALINQIPLAVWNALKVDWTQDAGIGPWPP